MASPTRATPGKWKLPEAAGESREALGNGTAAEQPLIPSNVLDAPSQRLYISASYLALTAWRLYDYFRLLSGESDSLWLFMKWVAIDGIFLYTLPELRIPWLTWSFTATTLIFLSHAISSAVLMFQVPVRRVPSTLWIGLAGSVLIVMVDTNGRLLAGLDKNVV